MTNELTPADYETISYEVADGILTLTLNRPDALNSFTRQMGDELEHAFGWVNTDDTVQAVVVTGAGRAFCAGMDLTSEGNVFGLDETQAPTYADMQDKLNDPDMISGVRDSGGMVTLAIYDCKKPVIAAINGAAVGIGATMTCAMDIRLASEKARIGFVFGKIGITTEACSSWFLPRIVGPSRALEMLYSAEIMNAETAQDAGLVRTVYSPEELLPAAYELARKFTQNRSPVATALTRQLVYRNMAAEHPVVAHQSDSLAIFYQSIADGKEGVRSFLEKRDPNFTGKASEMPPFYPWWE